MQGASVKVRNTGTNLEQTISTRNDGSFSVVDLPIGTYSVTVSKDGFKTEVFTQILVRGGLTTTVNASLDSRAGLRHGDGGSHATDEPNGHVERLHAGLGVGGEHPI